MKFLLIVIITSMSAFAEYEFNSQGKAQTWNIIQYQFESEFMRKTSLPTSCNIVGVASMELDKLVALKDSGKEAEFNKLDSIQYECYMHEKDGSAFSLWGKYKLSNDLKIEILSVEGPRKVASSQIKDKRSVASEKKN